MRLLRANEMTSTSSEIGHREEASSYFMRFVFHKLAIGGLLLVYFLILSVLYEKYISPIFGYRGFTIDRSPYKFGLSLIIIMLASTAISVNKKPSSMILYFYVIFMLIPQMSFAYNSNGYTQVVLYSTFAFFILYAFSHAPMRWVHVKHVNFGKFEKYMYVFIFSVLCYTVYKLGFDHFSFGLDDVYIRREILEQRYDKILANSIGLCFVFIIFISVIKSKSTSIQVIIPILLGLVFFGLTGHKRFAVIPISCVIIYRLVSLDTKYAYYAIIGSILLTGMYYIIFDMEYINVMENYKALFFTMFFTRTLSIPAQLNDLYYDFFSQNGYLFWSYSKIGLGFFQYDFDWTPAQLIGRHMFTEGSANTGMIGSGYMNAGVAGVAIYAVVAGLTLAFVDKVAELRGNRALYTMLALPSFVIIFTTSDLPNVYFSQGFGVILLMMWVFRIGDEPSGKERHKSAR